MDEKKTTPVLIDGVEYQLENMTQTQQVMISHLADLSQKITQAEFALDQLRVGREAFTRMLRESLKTETVTTTT